MVFPSSISECGRAETFTSDLEGVSRPAEWSGRVTFGAREVSWIFIMVVGLYLCFRVGSGI